MARIVHIGLRPSPRSGARNPGDEDHDDVAPETATTADDVPESSLDEQHHIGVLPNWESHYGYAEQLRRFETTTHENRVMGYAQMAASAASALFQRKWIERAKDTSVTLDALDLRMFRGGRIIIGVDPAFASG